MTIDTIIGLVAVATALFSYFVGKNYGETKIEKENQDEVLDDIKKAKEVSNKVDSFKSDDIIAKLSKYKK